MAKRDIRPSTARGRYVAFSVENMRVTLMITRSAPFPVKQALLRRINPAANNLRNNLLWRSRSRNQYGELIRREPTMPSRIVQCNLARCWDAQHLLHKHMVELDASICAVSEPLNIPNSPQWFGSGNRLAAIYWRRTDLSQTCRLVWRLKNCVVVEYLWCLVTSRPTPAERIFSGSWTTWRW